MRVKFSPPFPLWYYGCIHFYGRGVVTFAWTEGMCVAAVSNVSTVQPNTLSLPARLLTCLSDVPVSVLVGRTSVLDVYCDVYGKAFFF
jgi:hypothetical protein